MKIKGRVWVFGDDINTDLIFPHSAFRVTPEEQVKLIFSDNRPGWSSMVGKGDIIVAGRNFGTGSSRPGASLLLRLGIGCLIADSINGLFFRNCIGYGFPALQCPGVSGFFTEGETAVVSLPEGDVLNEQSGRTLQGDKIPKSMVETLEAGGIEKLLVKRGYMEISEN
jgi:3-isopropylmalate/(R)-2-methylmalate dehydratase small subunit